MATNARISAALRQSSQSPTRRRYRIFSGLRSRRLSSFEGHGPVEPYPFWMMQDLTEAYAVSRAVDSVKNDFEGALTGQ